MLSRFQKSWGRSRAIPRLPGRVLVMIIEYAAEVKRRSRPSGTATLGRLPNQLLPFMAVCSYWRTTICPLYYYEAFISIPIPEAASRISAVPAQDMLQIVRFGFDRIVKRLVLLLSRDVFAGPEMLTMLGLRLPANRLPSVTEIIHMSVPFRDICDILNTAMPNARYVAFTSQDRVYAGADSGCVELTNRLVRGKTSLTMSIPMKVPFNSAQPAPTNLTHIAVTRSTPWTYAIVSVIRFNSLSLVDLQLENIDLCHFRQLLVTSQKAAVIFKQLRRLGISLRKPEDGQRPVLDHNAFPSITHICSTGWHPLGDDSILRCNPEKLEVLRMSIDAPLFEILVRREALVHSKYPCLRIVDICCTFELRHLHRTFPLGFVYDRISDLSTCASSLRLMMEAINSQSAINLTHPSSTIRDLCLPWLQLDLEMLIRLGWRFPNLSSLEISLVCDFDGVSNAEPRERDIRRIQREVRIGNRLVALGVHVNNLSDSKRISEYTILLASLVPTLREVFLWPPRQYNVFALHDNLAKARKRSVYKDFSHMKTLRVNVKNTRPYL
ncbi:hypothetical protein DL89DRAFT_269408 [Linderina pennispora]|uniref:F-box domain-containing protein n=1 Tax=Linderina pennispora TaxID=61395 RepID=A0A1Y1W3A1_9FUNG|nr:uncharacterized protein DL89DRAFT_269408 [Linderina pennispora]ORX67634.1 hypothetical protein DL89DRAFT_269408 [Linderina pennispora]